MPSLSLLSAGSNARGQLATGNDEDAHLFAPCIFAGHSPGILPLGTRAVTQIACGSNHTLVLLSTSQGSQVWGSGDGRKGQLGPSHLADSGPASTSHFRRLDFGLHSRGRYLEGYSPRLIASGWETSYVVLSCAGRDDVLISMGADDYGNLGVGGVKEKTVGRDPIHVVDLQLLFDTELGNVDRTFTIRSLATGPHHIVIQVNLALKNGTSTQYLVGWGAARHGQVGYATGSSQKLPLFYTSPRIIALGLDDVQGLGSIQSIAAGNQHSVFLHSSGRLSALGSNRKAQLRGLGTLKDVISVGCTWHGTYATVRNTSGYLIMATGSHSRGQLGRGVVRDAVSLGSVDFPFPPSSHRLVKVACGSEHVLSLFELIGMEDFAPSSGDLISQDSETRAPRMEVWGWGWNEHGNLGMGSTTDVDVPVLIWPPADPSEYGGRAVDIWCGNGTSWIVIEQRK
ncbi:RCC1/BLIP-II [Laetiporus sulphureus 93-53]|uniref:RCC1/BLIP-II n=1 Tax=Laetiporus sulphureus 93-53 TaxID=1314785 RepID=A0A165BIW0_9APHY|nr:RCC1/BLIP-II [Laetiporus sulphureus 93-53]KZT01141.1 RCC1/BLIP-II [Laetiporus sulphureus 93-53]